MPEREDKIPGEWILIHPPRETKMGISKHPTVGFMGIF
jgi:hypothetical protein